MQDIDRVAHVQPLAKPARLRRLRVDVDAIGGVPCAKHRRRIARHPWRRRDLGDDASVGPPEAELAVCLSLHLKPFFVNRAVVPTTQHRKVRQRRRAAVRPVPDVMTLPESAAAAGKATALIAMLERAP